MKFRIIYKDKWGTTASMIYELTKYSELSVLHDKIPNISEIVPLDDEAKEAQKFEKLFSYDDDGS